MTIAVGTRVRINEQYGHGTSELDKAAKAWAEGIADPNAKDTIVGAVGVVAEIRSGSPWPYYVQPDDESVFQFLDGRVPCASNELDVVSE